MRGLNKVYLIGYLGNVPEQRLTPKGVIVVRLRVATPARRKSPDGTWVDATDWHSVTVFGRTAEFVARAGGKGDGIAIEGVLRPSRWTTKEGESRYEVDIVVDRLLFLQKKDRTLTPPELPVGDVDTNEDDSAEGEVVYA